MGADPVIVRTLGAFLACAVALPAQEVLWRRIGRPIGDPLGSQMLRFPVAFSDINGDGWPDVACTTISRDTTTHSILFLSGRDGSTIREFVDPSPAFFFYRTLVPCGDVDSDGVEDYAVTHEESGSNPIDNFIEVRSGVDDAVLWSVRGSWAQAFGRQLLGHGREVGVLSPDQTYSPFASEFTTGGSQPVHPFPTVVVWEPLFNSSSWQVGQVSLIRTAPSSVRPLGPGCTSLPASLPHIGYSVEGLGARIHVSGASPDALATLLVGVSSTSFAGMPLPRRLDSLGFVGCSLQTSIEASATTRTAVGLDRGSASFVVPRLAVPLYGQWAVLDRGSAQLSMSGGLRW